MNCGYLIKNDLVMNTSYTAIFVFLVSLLGYGQETIEKGTLEKEWMIGPFERFEDAKPIIQKDSMTTFMDPMTDKEIRWESMATFNPAAIVKDDKIHVLYRAEEKLGEKEIGGHTSRIGLAISSNGEEYVRKQEPVFYPDDEEGV